MEVRDRILHAAVDVFADVGFRGATTRRIASEAGVNEITLFRHFGSKEKLLQQALRAAGARAGATPLPDPPRKPRDELLDWARTEIRHLRQRRCLIRTCMAEVAEHPHLVQPGSHTVHAARQLTDYLTRLRKTGLATARFEPATAATMLMGTMFADAMGRDVMPELYPNDPDDALQEYVDLFLRGLGCGTSRPRRRKTTPA